MHGYLWTHRWDEARVVWLWVGWNILWTFYQPLILADIINEERDAMLLFLM